MCLDFLKNSLSDEFFLSLYVLKHSFSDEIIRHRIVFLVRKTFSDETFSSLKVFFFFLNQIEILVMKVFVTRTFSDGATVTK